ncbi:MAG: type III secretion inner membrane ring lipoprotein SctJ, partial [Puniceicoccales bacterium]|nr:type III secretion inner membrane ring lipoprotein SctJ [Puniceicoccales bacterium]
LNEKEANEMFGILLVNNIESSKVSGAENMWNINVASRQFAEAVNVLNEVGYPKDTFVSMGEVFKKTGLVSSPLEERVRFMHALSEKLSETLTHIYGVVTARVHIVLPDNNLYTEKLLPSSASVFISYLPHVNVEDFVKDIKQLVTNSIEGLTYDKVTVALFPSSTPKERLSVTTVQENNAYKYVLGLKVGAESVRSFWLYMSLLLLTNVLVFGLLVGLTWWRQKKKVPVIKNES